MNKLLAGLFLAGLLADVAHATERYQPSVGANALSQSGALAGANAVNGNVGVSNTIEAGDYSDLRIVPPAIAPNVTNNVICPIINVGSKAGSVFFFSGSGTTSPNINAICLAWHSNNEKLVHAIACNESKEYRKASEQVGNKCQ